ncbi:hypothetical protein [Bradyrhizobium sp. 190]|uniref:hypothetical protein n=1 Tax=Bradyrhizobium sp. 190 TaxID=2782658 RepID=UPI001FF862BC|nr:hypothetical protein [Bradyrhizobium sp. 190]
MDVNQFALVSMPEDHKEGVAAFLKRRNRRFLEDALTRTATSIACVRSPAMSRKNGGLLKN